MQTYHRLAIIIIIVIIIVVNANICVYLLKVHNLRALSFNVWKYST